MGVLIANQNISNQNIQWQFTPQLMDLNIYHHKHNMEWDFPPYGVINVSFGGVWVFAQHEQSNQMIVFAQPAFAHELNGDFCTEGDFLTRRVYGAAWASLGQNCRIQPLLFAHFREIKTGIIRLDHHLFTSPHHWFCHDHNMRPGSQRRTTRRVLSCSWTQSPPWRMCGSSRRGR